MPFRQLKSFFKILIGVQYQAVRASVGGSAHAGNYATNFPVFQGVFSFFSTEGVGSSLVCPDFPEISRLHRSFRLFAP